MNFLKSFVICSSKKMSSSKPIKPSTRSSLSISTSNDSKAKLIQNVENKEEKVEVQCKNDKTLSTQNSGISTKFSQHSQEPKKDELREKVQNEADKYTEFILSDGKTYVIEKKVITKIMEIKNRPTHCLDMEWSYEYADYLRNGYPRPKPIDNTQLKKLIEQKKARPDEDFVLVDELIWIIIMNLYGGGPEIIFDANSTNFEINDVKKQSKFVQKSNSNSLKDVNEPQKNSSALLENSKTENKNESKVSKIKHEVKNIKNEIIKNCSFIIGISNNSYYCFINTALQCLLTFPQLTNYFLTEKFLKIDFKTKKSFRYTHAYLSLISEITSNSNDSYITASNFKKMFKKNFSPYEMHDSQEFLRFLLSELQDEMNPPIPAKIVKKFQLADFPSVQEAWEFYQDYHPSIIDDLFAGQILSEIICPICDKVSNAYDPFLDLSLTITRSTSTIYECLELFCKKEAVEQYQCEGCKKKSKAFKSLRVSIEPKILVLHFKRFKIYPRKMKLTDRISFPINDFKLEKFSIDKKKSNYNLKAVAMHSGNVDYGHYVALAKRDLNVLNFICIVISKALIIWLFLYIKWYFFDDENVQKISSKDVQNQEAYLLFYEKEEKD